MLRHAALDQLPGQRRVMLRVAGADAERFLQGCVSADIRGANADHAVTAALLTVKGKIVADLVILAAESSGAFDVLVPADVAREVQTVLEDHVIMDDVTISPSAEIASLVWDEDGDEVRITGADVRVRASRHPLPTLLVVGPAGAVADALSDSSPVDILAFDRARIESGTPAWGREIVAGRFPPECGFTHAVSHDKGCFLGQEPIARIHARGQVNRVMVRVVLERVVDVPSQLSADARPDAGELTTCAGEIAGAGGLAIVRREFAVLGALLRSAGGVAVRVISGPLGDDPGPGTPA